MMKNSKFRRILLLLACAVLLASLSVGATLAYLTSTDEVENTFTVGDVQIKLDEAKVNTETGKAPDPKDRTPDGNKQVRMVPGRLIDKDPTVTVLKDSENCYVRVKVIVDVSGCTTVDWDAQIPDDENGGEGQPPKTNLYKLADIFDEKYIRYKKAEDVEKLGFNETNWTVVGEPGINPTEKTVTYILTYKNDDGKSIVAKATIDTELKPVFTHVYVPTNLDKDDLNKLAGMKIKVVAEAIQAEGFENATAAWNAFAEQKKIEEELQNPGNQEGSENQN